MDGPLCNVYGNIFECVFQHILLVYEGTTVTRKNILGPQRLPLYNDFLNNFDFFFLSDSRYQR